MTSIGHNDSEKYYGSTTQTAGMQRASGSGFEVSTEPLAKLGRVGTTIKEVLDKFKTSLQALDQQVEKNKAALEEHANQVTAAEIIAKKAGDEVDNVAQQAEKNTTALDQLDQNMQKLTGKLTVLDNLDEQLEPLNNLNAKLEPLAQLKQAEGELDKVADIDRKFKTLNEQFKEVAARHIKFSWENV